MMNFFTWLVNGGSTLSRLEKLVLDAISAQLEAGVATRWDQQVSAINKVQRLPDGVEVNFYRMKWGRVFRDPAIALPCPDGEHLIANVTLMLEGSVQKLAAEVWAVCGYVFSIEYKGGSKYFEEALGMEPVPRVEIECKLLADFSRQTGTS